MTTERRSTWRKVPALAVCTDDSRLDISTTGRYAERAASTWVDAFILSGTTTRGDLLTVEERAAILDLWLNLAGPRRLLACTWTDDDIEHASDRASRLPQSCETCRTKTPLSPSKGCLPVGGKLAKVSVEDITAIRDEAGPDFALWDASS